MFIGENGSAFLVDIKDVSKGGCHIARPRTWPFNVGDTGKVYIFGNVGIVPSHHARVIWFQGEEIGIEFFTER